MEIVSRSLVQHAQEMAREVAARALIIYADAIQGDGSFRELLQAVTYPTILVTRSTEVAVLPGFEERTWVTVPDIPMSRGRSGQGRRPRLPGPRHPPQRRPRRLPDRCGRLALHRHAVRPEPRHRAGTVFAADIGGIDGRRQAGGLRASADAGHADWRSRDGRADRWARCSCWATASACWPSRAAWC